MEEKLVCEECKKELPLSAFYTNKRKMISHICKDCECYKYDERAFCYRYDIPFIAEEFFNIRKHFDCKTLFEERRKVYGRYLSKMKLKGNQGFQYGDEAWGGMRASGMDRDAILLLAEEIREGRV